MAKAQQTTMIEKTSDVLSHGDKAEGMTDSALEACVREFFLRRLREKPSADLREFRAGILRSFNNLPETARTARRPVVLHCQATPQTIEVLCDLLGVVCP